MVFECIWQGFIGRLASKTFLISNLWFTILKEIIFKDRSCALPRYTISITHHVHIVYHYELLMHIMSLFKNQGHMWLIHSKNPFWVLFKDDRIVVSLRGGVCECHSGDVSQRLSGERISSAKTGADILITPRRLQTHSTRRIIFAPY